MQRFVTIICFLTVFFLSWNQTAASQQAENSDNQEQAAASSTTNVDTLQQALARATKIGDGEISAYRLQDRTYLLVPGRSKDRLTLWYAEAVSLPPEARSSNGVEIGRLVVSFERQGSRIMVRDHTSGLGKRAGNSPAVPGPSYNMPQQQPIAVAVNQASKGPIVAVFPIVAEDDSGNILIDVTDTFSGDLESLTARYHIQSTGMDPGHIDPNRSYIDEIRVFNNNVEIRSHLTFLTSDPSDPGAPAQPMSIEVGHSFITLPQEPMQPREFDSRVGFFNTEYKEFESAGGATVEHQRVVLRWRLEKTDPGAAVSTPVKPIVFYLSREIPLRWRPYIRAGVEQWQPVFEAAGFKDAILAVDAPDPAEDPSWSPYDARYSVIRWLAQSYPNAIGPNVFDPRSGEVLSAHIQIWPEVLDMFERYYYSVVGTLDPEAGTLPMSDAKRGELLQYIVAHEVGHALGLRHNHLASTAYSIKEMRDPAFANVHGANSSIMAYGRFNQVAQPGDGITRFLPIIGPYDYFAINWGYGVHGNSPEEEKALLKRMVDVAQNDRRLLWAAGEMIKEQESWQNDPRLQKENTGAERVEATRLAIANVLRSLSRLPEAVGSNRDLYRETLVEMLLQHDTFLKSVAKVVGGTLNNPSSPDGPLYSLVPAEQQKEAVSYLLGEGVRSLDAYKDPSIITQIPFIGGIRTVESMQAELLETVFSGQILAKLDEQQALEPDAYGQLDLIEDTYRAVWGDIPAASRWQLALQDRYLDICERILTSHQQSDKGEMATMALMYQGYGRAYSSLVAATGADTVFPAWARENLPHLKENLLSAAESTDDPSVKYHFQAMAWRIDNLQ